MPGGRRGNETVTIQLPFPFGWQIQKPGKSKAKQFYLQAQLLFGLGGLMQVK